MSDERSYFVRLKTESPTALSVRRATGNVLDTRHSFSGGAMRGALAAAVIEQRGFGVSSEPWFQQLFVDGLMRCSDLRIEGSVPWTMSAVECKSHRGEFEHDLTDNLLRAAAGMQLAAECRTCGSKLEQPSGFTRFFRASDEQQSRDHTAQVTTLRTAHVQIDTRYRRAKSGQLYSSECLAKGQEFLGWMHLPVGSLKDLFGVSRAAKAELWIGRGRTRGQGRVTWEASEVSEEDIDSPFTPGTIAERIRVMNEKASKYPLLKGKLVISCTLRSPLLLFDRWLLPKLVPDACDIGLGEEFHLLRGGAFARQEIVTGWHGVANLPKAEVVTTAAGSCFLYARDVDENTRQTEQRRLAERLASVQRSGVGERTEDGFGEVFFCDSLHERLAA